MMEPTSPDQNVLLTKKDFNDKYWFGPFQMVTVVNHKDSDYRFMVEMRHFIIKAGKRAQFPGTVANVYLSQMSRIMAQDDDRMELLSDINLMKWYYDHLIVEVKSLIQEDKSVPDYMKNVPKANIDNNPVQDTPPWAEDFESASKVATAPPEAPVAPPVTPPEPPTTPPIDPLAPKPKVKPEAGTKEFELNGLKFKAVTDDKGETEFFKNDKPIDSAAYNKAASML